MQSSRLGNMLDYRVHVSMRQPSSIESRGNMSRMRGYLGAGLIVCEACFSNPVITSLNGQNVSLRGRLSVASLPWRLLCPRSVISTPSRALRGTETEVLTVDEPLSSSYAPMRFVSTAEPMSAGLDWRDAGAFVCCPGANTPIVMRERVGGSGGDCSSSGVR